jgi:cation-transporting ATPase 13A2
MDVSPNESRRLPIGFNTTKGALVRSMLFPKPMGFKFYRDSMRFIVVLAGIAVLGFMASAVQFVKLGASSKRTLGLLLNLTCFS